MSPRFRPERLTLPLLLLALSTLFLCNVDDGYFYIPGNQDWSVMGLSIAENLSPDHNFRLFRQLNPGPGGAPTYGIYSRFPVGGYALVKLAILPFGNDLSAKVLAARMLMLLLFSGAALLAFHSLARITSRRWVALAATLAAFSSYYMLFYGNAVYIEGSVDLFAVMLVFHGMVVFVQEGRFRQLLARTFVALLLGWHVYAFLLPFILLGLAREAVRAWKHGTAVRLRSAGAAVLHSRYTALGLASLLFGAAVLGFNFANEYGAFGGETQVTELPSVQSMLRRTGLDRDFAPFDWWLRFLQGQFFRVCVASVPLVLSEWGVGLLGSFLPVRLSASGLSGPALWVCILALVLVVGAATTLVRLARPLLDRRQRMLLAALALSGFFWTLPMRHNAVHLPLEAMYYVGVPLAFYSLLLLHVRKRWGHGPVVGLAAVALLAFVVSAFRMDHGRGSDARAVEVQRTAMGEVGAIRETIRGKAVLVLGSVEPEWSRQLLQSFVWYYYLAGSVSIRGPLDVEFVARAADFIVTHDRVESDALLTPGNELLFLYDSAGIDDLVELYRSTFQQAASGDPVPRSYFNVYIAAHNRIPPGLRSALPPAMRSYFHVYSGDDALTFVKDPCIPEDAKSPIFVDVIQADRKHLGGMRLRYDSRSPEFGFPVRPVRFEGKCIAVVPLPDYPISGIRAKQRLHRSRDRLVSYWEVGIPASR